jgi:hypothetical protein
MEVGHFDLHRIAEEVLSRLIDHDVGERQDPGERDGTECADHEQRAVGEVDHAQSAKDQCQAQGNQRIGAALVQTVQNLQDDGVHRSHLSRSRWVGHMS